MYDAPILELDQLTFAYREGRELLNKASLSLRPGEHLGFYGPNGCGKTTLFRLIMGLSVPSGGRILFHGQAVQGELGFRMLRRRVGLVLQHAEDQLFCPTVLEDVAFGPLNLGMGREEAAECARQTLRRLGLDGFESRLTHRLSGGEKKLVSLAAVMAMSPEVLLLDEPTNGLDPEARERLIAILNRIPDARIAISHDWDFLAETSSGYLTLADGKLSSSSPSLFHRHVHNHPLGDVLHRHEGRPSRTARELYGTGA